MTPEQIERNRAFIRDLRANEKKAKSSMRNPDGGRCCLCVALDTAFSLGFKATNSIETYTAVPPDGMGDFYGWDYSNPDISNGGERAPAAVWNDGSAMMGLSYPELTHAEIADAFEATFPEIKP